MSKYEFSLLRLLSIVTLLAFVAERHALCLRLKPLLQSACVCYRSDGQTDTEAFHRPCSAYADSVNKTALSERRSERIIFFTARYYCCHEASYFKAKIHLIRFRLGVRPRPRCGGAYSAPQHLLAGLKGPTCKRREEDVKIRGGVWTGRREGNGTKAGRKGSGGKRKEVQSAIPPPFLSHFKPCTITI